MVHFITDNLREDAKRKLNYFLKNPGYFSILVLGDNGVGKEFILKEILEDNDISIFYPDEIGDTDDTISSIFNSEYIIIKNVEQLTEGQQRKIFRFLSTADGKIGFGESREFRRIIFTSSFSIEHLRDEKEYLLDMFWDRISQLVVKIPSFKDTISTIFEDFTLVWNKFEFKNHNALPNQIDLKLWLQDNCQNFAGNFRDLDKIAILWHQYRIIEYDGLGNKIKAEIESKIFYKVKNDFESFTHFPTQKSDTSNIFEFEKGKSWQKIEEDFKSKFKKWARESYGTYNNAYKELKMPYRKMEKW
ncbi:ATP-binding protein [Carboxylicivirga sp. M1479]|uniref:ATP-binding protein n=1 Tax=Carboxylicivirga sp. M1479 TaxID=2594476 RepID=UPI0011785868|nr:ATP-binding protein [Carboxylicivirga sp. M1479]TRX70697.1 ATP-binding protein [Carboxylicivirga sp. M1479]